MPNGHPEFHLNELPALEEFFGPVSAQLTDFGRRHNLKLRKYYHQAPAWTFTFRHPRGGIAKIEVSRREGSTLGISGSWWCDDYSAMQRYLKRAERQPLGVPSPHLGEELEACLHVVLAWDVGHWDECHGGYGMWQKQWTKEQFEALLNEYPVPE
jgi:hypothetical protein